MKKIPNIIKVSAFVGVLSLLGIIAYFQWLQNTLNKKTTETSRKVVYYFVYTNTNSAINKDNGIEVRLKSMDLSTKKSEELLYLSGAKGSVYPASNYTFHGQKFYFIDKDGHLVTVGNNFKTVSLVDLHLEKGEYVSDYLLQGDVIYYLAGPFCAEYEGQCNNTLRSIHTKNGTTTTFFKGIKESSISGFSLDGNSIFLSWLSGDAGCTKATFLTISLMKKNAIGNNSFGWCFGEFEAEGDNEKYDEFVKNIYSNATTTNYIVAGREVQFNEDDKKVIDLITPVETVENSYSSLEFIKAY